MAPLQGWSRHALEKGRGTHLSSYFVRVIGYMGRAWHQDKKVEQQEKLERLVLSDTLTWKLSRAQIPGQLTVITQKIP